MAIIPVHHVIADNFNIDPDWSFTVDGEILAGMAVTLDADGYVDFVTAAGNVAFGLAGDTLSDSTASTPYADDLAVGADGAGSRSTQNRVPDFYNETLASGKMTIYHGGGRFMTDQYEAGDTFAVGDSVYSSTDGEISTTEGTGNVLGIVAAAPAAYPSGVPGTDIDGSISLGTYLDLILRV
ncbi:MAG: DUF2190 family protein [Elusimicrobiota bacterium]